VIFNVLFVFGGNMKFDARVVLMLVLGALAVGVGHSAEIDASAAGINSSRGEGSNIALKRKVAIARFSNETQSTTSFLLNKSGDRVGKQASDILSARLASTGQFLMFERIDASKTSAEQVLKGIQESGVAVDYLIMGSVSEFGRSTESSSGVFSRAKSQKAYAKVNVRLVDVSTGRIIHSTEGAGESVSETKKTLGVGSTAGFDQSLTDKAISAAISQVIGNLVESMIATPWRSYLLSNEGDGYFIAGGSKQGLRSGTVLAVYKSGKTITNPQTGAVLTLPGSKVGKIKIVTTFDGDEFSEVSYAELVSGDIGSSLEEFYLEEK